MKITFYGAVREVTGSMHMIEANNSKILLDCGLFQGKRKETEQKNSNLPFYGGDISNVVLSHAHIDHSGRLPLLTRSGFSGSIFSTCPTADVCRHLLTDSAKIQESDADYLNYKTVKRFLHHQTSNSNNHMSRREKKNIKNILKKSFHELKLETIHGLMTEHRLKKITPLYTIRDAENSLEYFDAYPYEYPFFIGNDITCTFYDAGHILGSALSFIRIKNDGRYQTVAFTGDIGRFNKPILRDPTLKFRDEHREIDLLVMESTYGNRRHEETEGLKNCLRDVLIENHNKGGTVVIPAFAFGRTQEIIYYIRELYDANEVPKVPVYVDSPLAGKLTKVTGEHLEAYDAATHEKFLKQGENPFIFHNMHFTHSVEESMTLMRDESTHIVISASGMCEFGRILHHLRHKIHDPRNTILVVGYMAERTMGRRMLDLGLQYEKSGRSGPPPVLKFLNKEYPLKARVVQLEGFSGHGDRDELLRWIKGSNLKVKRIAVVHGEESQSLALQETLSREGFSAFLPEPGQSVEII